MSVVKKWYIGVYGGDAQARPCSPAEFEIIHAGEGRYFVLAEDFDNATRLFLDAAERCVASERREKELQHRLTAADELNDVMLGLMQEFCDRVDRVEVRSKTTYAKFKAALSQNEKGQCKTCNGTRIVSDGAMYCSSGGIPFECGPIECVKDCPECTKP